MSELNVLVVTGLELVDDSQGKRVNLLLTENKYVEAGVDTVSVRRPIFDPETSSFTTKTAPWYRKALEILGQNETCDNVKYNDKPWKIEGEIAAITLPLHYFKDKRGKYVVDSNGDKRTTGGFKTAVFGFETVEGVTNGFRNRIDPKDIVKTASEDLDE
jgi:hypothetical protein